MVSATSVVSRWRASGALRPLLSGSAWSFVMQSVAKGTVLLTTLIAARLLGVADFGLFVSLQAVMFVSASAWDLGVGPMLTRDVAARDVSLESGLRRAAGIRLRLLPLWLVIYVGGAILLGVRGGEPLVAAVILGLAAILTGISFLLEAGLQGQLQFRAAAVTASTGRLVFAVAAMIVALLRPSPVLAALSGALLLGALVTLSLQYFAVRRLRAHPARAAHERDVARRSTIQSLRRSLPLALNGFFSLVYNRLDVAVVSIVAGVTVAGLYAPASRLQDALLLFPMTGVAALTPVAARRYAVDGRPESVRHHLLLSIGLSLLLTIPPVIGVVLLARPLVEITLGSEYLGSVTAVRILALSMPFVAIGAPITAILVATNRAALTTLQFVAGMIVTMGGLLLLAPVWGAEGAAVAAMSREPVIAAVGLLLLARAHRRREPEPAVEQPALGQGGAS